MMTRFHKEKRAHANKQTNKEKEKRKKFLPYSIIDKIQPDCYTEISVRTINWTRLFKQNKEHA